MNFRLQASKVHQVSHTLPPASFFISSNFETTKMKQLAVSRWGLEIFQNHKIQCSNIPKKKFPKIKKNRIRRLEVRILLFAFTSGFKIKCLISLQFWYLSFENYQLKKAISIAGNIQNDFLAKFSRKGNFGTLGFLDLSV